MEIVTHHTIYTLIFTLDARRVLFCIVEKPPHDCMQLQLLLADICIAHDCIRVAVSSVLTAQLVLAETHTAQHCIQLQSITASRHLHSFLQRNFYCTKKERTLIFYKTSKSFFIKKGQKTNPWTPFVNIRIP